MPYFDLRKHLKAEVFDIRKPDCQTELKIVVDTNVLYFTYYDRFDQLGVLNEDQPRTYQIEQYPAFIEKLLNNKSSLFVHRINLFEFSKTVEIVELKILYYELNKPNVIWEEFKPKKVRLEYLSDYRKIQQAIVTYLNSITKTFELINVNVPCNRIAADFLFEWTDSIIDAGDAMLIAEAKRFGLTSILSDDADFATLKGIRLYTANDKVL